MKLNNEDKWPQVARCFIANPGGAYDPAPLPDLDVPAGFMPAVGDYLFDAPPRGLVERVYRVTERHYQPTSRQIALIVEEVEKPAVTPFV
ncbi:hypothetical protein [Paracoccus sp. (in: a-proteobacteria)]|uniref:hypothetical protein n=1 Tax=Paracoccus sp. TaxID=267 RepID=UPI0026DFF32F|nr:hypothetical protein [Paracoccus sp. (in: a-proteobacteria)]MDO5370569.1 hypothetical protein [Paracoccus sp. (in: a-proteobacteria)]